jgi:acrylyl-CoA reductase (NADPH)
MSKPLNPFNAFRIHNDADGYRNAIETIALKDLSQGEILIKTAYSSVNYKDALAGTGQGKILRHFPLNGGIDVAGTVIDSTDTHFKEGDEVLCTGSGLSETRDGGYSEYARLESKWAVKLPKKLTLKESMIIGTAGFTAALALYRMEQNTQHPALGQVVGLVCWRLIFLPVPVTRFMPSVVNQSTQSF